MHVTGLMVASRLREDHARALKVLDAITQLEQEPGSDFIVRMTYCLKYTGHKSLYTPKTMENLY